MASFIPYNFSRAILLCVTVFFSFTLTAQIGTPGVDIGIAACASDSFNEFFTEFNIDPTNFSSTNEFIIELSDTEGNFGDPLEVGRATIDTNPNQRIAFSLPGDAASEEYRVRIRSTSPVFQSQPSPDFAGYFRIHDSPFTINGLIEEAAFCPGTGFLLTIDETDFEGIPSPLNFDSLTFNWFRVIDETNFQLVSQGETFEVSTPGIYFARTNYGECATDSFSNRVTVSQATDDQPASAVITSSLGNPFCSTGEGTTLTTIDGDTHEWFRDGEPIDNAGGNTFQTDISGEYTVIVTTAGCVAVGSINLVSLGGLTTIDVPEVNFIESGGSLSVTVSTTVEDVQYEWLLNGNIIDGATESTFTATSIGFYTVRITGLGDCDFVTELSFELRIIVDAENIPNLISPNGDSINDTWNIPAEFVSGTNTEVIIISSNGETVLQTREYINNWPDDLNQLSGTNQVFYYMINPESGDSIIGSITVLR